MSDSGGATYEPNSRLRNGQVVIADPSTGSLRPLDKVVTGRDEQGNPYWDFTVHARYFDGYISDHFPGLGMRATTDPGTLVIDNLGQ